MTFREQWLRQVRCRLGLALVVQCAVLLTSSTSWAQDENAQRDESSERNDRGDVSTTDQGDSSEVSGPEGQPGNAESEPEEDTNAQTTSRREASDIESDSESPDGEHSDSESPDEETYPDDDTYPEDASLSVEDGYPGEITTNHQVNTRYVLERVEIRGLSRTSQDVVRRHIDLEIGQVIRPSDDEVEHVEWSVRNTGWFSSVDVHLERGRERGHVVLVVQVEERNTIILRDFTFGFSEGVSRTIDSVERLRLYIGASVSERNLFGTGGQLTLSGLGSGRARGFRVDYMHPYVVGNVDFHGALYYNNAREYFSSDPTVDVTCPEDPEVNCEPENAVVGYKRAGLSLGIGHRGTLQTRIMWQGERIVTGSLPNAASENRGGLVVPIDFRVYPNLSFLSALSFDTSYDRRDDPSFTREGTFVSFSALFAHSILGSDYSFARIYASFKQWFPIGQRHAIRLGARGGFILGDAPFFVQFHVADFSDFIPGRYLEMQLDRRTAPGIFGTSVELMQQQDLAARVDVEYSVQLYRGTRILRALNLYVNAGVFAIGDVMDARRGFPEFTGASGFPVDLTMDLGFRLDLGFGVIQLGFSNVFGFLAL